MLCIASAGTIAALAATTFTLEWTHSVERTLWHERWEVAGDRLQLVEASVQGPGAGIGLPPDATWTGGRWRYEPQLPPLPELVLAASGATASPWTLCHDKGTCLDLGAQPGEPVRIWSASACRAR